MKRVTKIALAKEWRVTKYSTTTNGRSAEERRGMTRGQLSKYAHISSIDDGNCVPLAACLLRSSPLNKARETVCGGGGEKKRWNDC